MKEKFGLSTLFQKEKFKDIKFDIVFLIGQSNAEGHGAGEVENEYVPCDEVFQFADSYPVMYRANEKGIEELDVPEETTYRITVAKENTRKGVGKLGCFGIYFAKRYYEDFCKGNGRCVLLLRCAIGGSGFMRKQWTADGVLYKRAMEMAKIALSLNEENRIAAILWHQGENEVVDGKNLDYNSLYSFYKNELTSLISNIRKNSDFSAAPFIAGGFSEDWRPRFAEGSLAVTDATLDTLSGFQRTAFVDVQGLKSNDSIFKDGDDIHFCRKALYELADRYYQKFLNT